MAIREIPIPKPSRLIKQQAEATIQSLIDAVVELVTNSDDSYIRSESGEEKHTGQIEIYVSREKGGRVKEFYIKDFAEGMSKENLEKAIAYGEEVSGLIEGKSVRGLLGRGLKEAILGLGEGEIFTRKNGILNTAKIWWDNKQRKALYEIFENSNCNSKFSEIEEFIRQKENGTFIKIKVKNERIKIPEYEGFKMQISDHYALREVNSSKERKIKLVFTDLRKRGIRTEAKIEFQEPNGELKFNDLLKLPKYKDKIWLKIKESPLSLGSKSPRIEPWSKTGILIKTKGAILDNQLFRYENEPAAYYFFGEVFCESIAQKLKEGQEGEIIDLNRKGLNWKAPYCQTIQKTIEKILEPLIQEKKKELEEGEERKIPSSRKKLMDKLSGLLNQLAEKEIEEWEGPGEPPEKIEKLTIIPPRANIELNKPKLFTIYAPDEVIQKAGSKVSISSESDYIKILVSSSKQLVLSLNINLVKHPKKLETWYGSFKIVGKEIRKETFIHCKLDNQWVDAEVKVVEPKVIEEKEEKEKKKKKGGLFSGIEPDSMFDPPQRARYIDTGEDKGTIKIYINFPGVKEYLGSRFKGIETREGRVILAEVVGEIFCRTMIEKGKEKGKFPWPPGDEIGGFITTVSDLQKKYLNKIHKAVLNYKFK